MKRSQLVFVTAVFSALCTGILVERSNSAGPELDLVHDQPRHIPFEDIKTPKGVARLAGVVETSDGEPAIGVGVHLTRRDLEPGAAEPLHADTTDAAGRFRFSELLDGEYEVILLQPAHPTVRFVTRVPATEEVRWRLSEPLPELPVLPPIERSQLVGRLAPPVGFTPRDTPLEGYEIVLSPTADAHPLSGAVTRRLAVDPKGAFQVDDLVQADYLVRVMPRWASGGSWPVLEEVRYTHAANTGVQPLNLRLDCGEVQGRVVDVERNPLQGALVQVWPMGDESRLWPPVQANANGWFKVSDLPPGSYEVVLQAGAARRQTLVTIATGGRPFLQLSDLDPREGGF